MSAGLRSKSHLTATIVTSFSAFVETRVTPKHVVNSTSCKLVGTFLAVCRIHRPLPSCLLCCGYLSSSTSEELPRTRRCRSGRETHGIQAAQGLCCGRQGALRNITAISKDCWRNSTETAPREPWPETARSSASFARPRHRAIGHRVAEGETRRLQNTRTHKK